MAWVPFAAMGASMLMDKFMNNDKMNKVATKTKTQQALMNQLLQMVGPQGQYGRGQQNALNLQQQYMDPSSQAVQQFTQPYMDQFNNQIVPGLAERFAGAGAMGGGLSSSGFGQSLSTAGSQLQNQLAALKAGIGQQAANSLMGQYNNMLNLGLGTDMFAYQQKAPTATGGLMQGWAQSGFARPSMDFTGGGSGYTPTWSS